MPSPSIPGALPIQQLGRRASIKPLGKSLTHNRNQRGCFPILIGDHAAVSDRDLQDGKIIRPDYLQVYKRCLGW